MRTAGFIFKARWRGVLVGITIPVLGALLICGLASVWPLRLDIRSLQDIHALQRAGLSSSGRFVFLSENNRIESARTATFGLTQLAFPNGSLFWAVLKENCDGPWSTGFIAVDQAGRAHRISSGAQGRFEWSPEDETVHDVRERARTQTIVYDLIATRDRFEQRWPFLRNAREVVVLEQAPKASRFEFQWPRSELTMQRIKRIAALCGTYVGLVLLLLQSVRTEHWSGWVIAAIALYLAVALNFTAAYLLQCVASPLVPWSPTVLWALTLIFYATRRRGRSVSLFLWPASRGGRLAIAYCLTIYAALFLARLDFDGDFFNNWLPQGRYHFLLGGHDPAAIMSSGSMQAATYPPGVGITLSLLMDASGMSPHDSFLISRSSSFAILLYRLLVLALNTGLLLLLAAYLRKINSGKAVLWVSAMALTLLLLPTTAGKHIAAETLLFPLLAASIILIAAGRDAREPFLTSIGLAICGLSTMVKWEAGLVMVLAVLPWLVSQSGLPPLPLKIWLGWGVILSLALGPVLLWKLTLPLQNRLFDPVTWSGLVASLHELPKLAARAMRLTLEDGRLLLVGVALPCAALHRFLRSQRWAELAVPLGIYSLLGGFILIFLFSNIDAISYLDVSYSRLIMVPVFGAILYCAEALGQDESALL